MVRLPPIATRTYPPFPYTTLSRSGPRQSPARWRRGVRGADTRVQTCGGLTGVREKAALGGDHGSVSLEGFRMEFHVRLAGARPDLDALGDAIRVVDPSELPDIYSCSAPVRVAAAFWASALGALLGGAGTPVTRHM